MSDQTPLAFGRESRRLKLDTLVRLRWLAVTGQCMAVAFVHLKLGHKLPFGLCLAVIALSAAVNLWFRVRRPASYRLSEDAATGLLAFDIFQLSALLFLTGGLQNPFAMLFMAPVLIAAAALPPGRTLALGLVAAACATLLLRFHLELPWKPSGALALPDLYILGVWTSILLGIGFTSILAWRIAEEAQQLGQALAATELVLAREQHLSQLDGLAAAAAHELGTPLATIRLVARELDLQVPAGTPMADDIALLRGEVERCRLILAKLTSLGEGGDAAEGGFFSTMSLGHLVEDVVSPRRAFDIAIDVERTGAGPEPVCRRSPGLLYGLGNLVDNAADFAASRVSVVARWSAEVVSIEIRDDGPGFSPSVLLRVGEPYVTTRPGSRDGEGGDGLGLGLFIAKTLIERSGGTLSLWNAPPPNGGAVARIQWPREVFDLEMAAHPADEREPALAKAEAAPI